MYSYEEKIKAVNLLIKYHMAYTATIRELGYPCKHTLRKWLNNRFPDRKRLYTKSKIDVECKETIKKEVAIKSHKLNKKETKTDLAKAYEISRTTLYNWNKKLLGDEYMNKKTKDFSNMEDINELKSEIEKLKKLANELEKKNFELQLENDILTKANEIIKKDEGVNLNELTNKEKAQLIDAYFLNKTMGYRS